MPDFFKQEPLPSPPVLTTAIKTFCDNHGLESRLVHVEPGYYDRPLESRTTELSAPTPDHLCKSVVFENTKWKPMDELQDTGLDMRNPRYIIVVVQYTSKISTKKLNLLMRSWGGFKRSLKSVNMRLCDSEVCLDLYRFLPS